MSNDPRPFNLAPVELRLLQEALYKEGWLLLTIPVIAEHGLEPGDEIHLLRAPVAGHDEGSDPSPSTRYTIKSINPHAAQSPSTTLYVDHPVDSTIGFIVQGTGRGTWWLWKRAAGAPEHHEPAIDDLSWIPPIPGTEEDA